VRVGKASLYAVLAVAAAVAYGAGVGPYWVIDLVVFAVVAAAVGFFCFARKSDTESIFRILLMGTIIGKRYAEVDQGAHPPDQVERVARSRIAHYATVYRTKSERLTAWLRRQSDSPFERALFSEPGWQTLSEERLEEISKMAQDAADKNAH
jgi:hypothetical protein